ncbi:MAG: exodeoxyribonuclease III [Myxococcaceae bacterium]
MKVSTWNVNGIRAREGDVLAWIERELPDVLCLQEIKASPENIPLSLSGLDGYWSFWHGHKGYSGVSLHLRKAVFPVAPIFEHPHFDHETRIVIARVAHWVFASIYVPNGGKDFPAKINFLQQMEELVVAEHKKGNQLVLCGDLNVAKEERDVHPSLRKAEQIGQTPPERGLLSNIIARELTDLHRVFEPDNNELYTWWAPWRNLRQKNVGWRLDYILPSPVIAKAATSCRANREFGTSDHAPVTATFDITLPVVTDLAEVAPVQAIAPAAVREQLSPATSGESVQLGLFDE